MINPWLQFLVCAVIIVIAGSRLTGNAAIIAKKTGIGTAWAGVLLLPLATSLPELVTTLSAVAINAPDLALGNVLGSCLFNIAILFVIDLVEGKGPLSARISQAHIITASLSIMTISLAAIGLLGITYFPVGWVGLETLLIAAIYLLGSRLIYVNEKKALIDIKTTDDVYVQGKDVTAGRALLNFMIAALFILVVGVLLVNATDRIAIETGLGYTFVGSIFLAISTSLPEVVTTMSAIRLGFPDMAVANIFGANFMNLLIVFIADLFYTKGPLLSAASDGNILSALMVIMLSSIFIFGLLFRSEKTVIRVGFDTLLILFGYLVAAYLLFKSGGN